MNPLTVTRQSVALRDEFNQAPVNPTVSYDPVRRVVTLSNPSDGKPWLVPGLAYKVFVPAAQVAGDGALRAIDGSGVTKTLVLGFFAAPPAGRAKPAPVSFCRDVFPILNGCRGCHGAPSAGERVTAWAGLVLETETGIEATAKRRVAQQTNTGARPVGAPPGPLFGVDMPIIDPGNPGNSFLLYKLLVAPPSATPRAAAATCGGPTAVPTWDVAIAPQNDEEQLRLANVIPGRPMPLSGAPVSLAELDRLREWIAEGAAVESCDACRPTP